MSCNKCTMNSMLQECIPLLFNFSMALILDCTSVALLALARNLSTNACMCWRSRSTFIIKGLWLTARHGVLVEDDREVFAGC